MNYNIHIIIIFAAILGLCLFCLEFLDYNFVSFNYGVFHPVYYISSILKVIL